MVDKQATSITPQQRGATLIGLNVLALSVALAFGAMPRHAQAQETPVSISIPAQSMDAALEKLGEQAGLQIFYLPETVRGLNAPAVSGSLTVDQALGRLLAGTGVEFRRTGKNVSLSRPGAATQLAPVLVTGSIASTTEGTGSYTTAGPSTTATGLGLTLRETPQSVSVMTHQRIEDEGVDSIETLLDRTPGISVQNIGTSRFSIQSRGYAIDNYQFDGILTAIDVVSQNIPQGQTDLAIYDRVEVIRGATGLLTGAGDPSGTINLVRKKPTREFQGYASAGGSSFGSGRGELDLGGPINEAGTFRGRFVAAHEQGDTHIDYYKQKKSVFYGVLEADLTPRTLLTAGFDYQNSDPRGQSSSGLPLFYNDGKQTGFSASDNAAARWNRNRIEVYNAFLNMEHRFANDWSLKVAGNYLHGDRSFTGADASWGFPGRETGDGVMLYGGEGYATQRQTGFDAQLGGPFKLWGRAHDFVLGFNWSEFENLHTVMDEPYDGAGPIEGRPVNIYDWGNDTPKTISTGEKWMDYNGWQKQYGTYAALRMKPRDDLSVILGTRISNYEYHLESIFPFVPRSNNTTRMRESGVVTPYAGIVYDINDVHSVYASYTSIFKPQSHRDRNGGVLDPREGDNYEIGLKSEFLNGRLNSAIALYQIRQDNLAEADPGQTVPDTQNEPAYRSVKGAKTTGLDIELGGELAPGWQAALSYNYSISKDANGETINTVFPRHMAKLWTTYRLPGAWHRLTVGAGLNYQSRIHFNATTWQLPGVTLEGEQKAYVVANLMAKYDFNQHLSATLNINNVFNKKYLQGLDTTFYTGIYAPTRSAMLNLKYQF